MAFFPEWSNIFGKERATGDRSWDPTKAADDNERRPQMDIQDDYVPTAEWNPEAGFNGNDEEPPLSLNMNCDPTVNSSSATKRTSSSRK
ncbi:UNVERIFIED_CONTAM: hypothetical protein Slati_3842700 [Sesamum latifolium]|uniref:Uncharacterized protein n=1 Tax=Sesamum latifolium TaxID=2727402 RepID=A0AAW2TM35_9LAMI